MEIKIDFVGDARKQQALIKMQNEAVSKALENQGK